MKPILACLLCMLAFAAVAGEPMATEDASILPRGACQVEAWWRHEHGAHYGWTTPACSVTDDLELATGFAYYRATASHGALLLQAKPMLYRDADRGFALAAVLAILRDTARASEARTFHQANAALVATFEPAEALRVHANAGVATSRGEFTTTLVAAGVEADVAPRWTLLAEMFRDSPGRPQWQGGARYTLLEDRLEFFASGGQRLGMRDSRFAKLGLRVQFDAWR